MKTPILYVLTSSENDLYLEELWVSLFSLHHFNKEVTVKVLSDESTAKRIKANPELFAMIDDLYPVEVPEEYPAKERSRFIKTNIRFGHPLLLSRVSGTSEIGQTRCIALKA